MNSDKKKNEDNKTGKSPLDVRGINAPIGIDAILDSIDEGRRRWDDHFLKE